MRVSVAAEVARSYSGCAVSSSSSRSPIGPGQPARTLRLGPARCRIGEEQDVERRRALRLSASIPPIRSAVAQREHHLAVLIGVRPGGLGVDLTPRAYPPLTKALAIGEPGSLLRRRPDVRAAERRLASATGREGVAAAELFPQISISGFLGLLAGRGSGFFNVSDSRAWAVTPALSWAAFDIGSARARLRGAEGATRESIAEFEQVVLRARRRKTHSSTIAKSKGGWPWRSGARAPAPRRSRGRGIKRASSISGARRGTQLRQGTPSRKPRPAYSERHRGLQGPRRNPIS